MRPTPSDFLRLHLTLVRASEVLSASSRAVPTTSYLSSCVPALSVSRRPAARPPISHHYEGGTMSFARTLFIILPMAAAALAIRVFSSAILEVR